MTNRCSPDRLAALTLLLVLGGGRVDAQEGTGPKFRFNPSVGLGYSVTDNVNYLDDPTTATAGDTSAQLSANLPVERRFRTGLWNLQYNGSWSLYADNSALDNGSHYFNSGFDFDLTRRSSLSVNAVYALTQLQAVPRQTPDFVTGDELFLGERQEMRSYGIGLGYGLEIGPTWNWNVNVSGSRAGSTPIEGYQSGTSGLPRQDSSSLSAQIHFERQRSKRFSLGGSYGFDRFDLGDEGVEDVHALSLTWSRKIGRHSTFAGQVGGFHRSRDVGDPASPSGGYDSDGALVSASYSYTADRGVSTEVGLTVAPTSGGTLEGTSTNKTIHAFLTGTLREKLSWELGGYYSVRESSDETLPTLEVLSAIASVEHAIQKVLGLRLQGSWAEQTSDVEGYATGGSVIVGLSCVWYPLGHSRMSRG